MPRHALLITVLGCFLGCLTATAQIVSIPNNCPYSHHAKELACLIPDLTKTGNSSNLAGFNTTLAQVLGQLPLAVPVSGFALSFDRTLHIYVVSSAENLGSVLTERGDTIGKHKLFVGFTFQRFVFHAIDGTSLSNLPTISLNPSSGIFSYSQNSLGANINQYTAVAAFGLTNRIDVSVTLPFERVSLSAANNLKEAIGTGTPVTLPYHSLAGSANGPGDLLLNLKGTVWKGEKFRVALGGEFRLPTGNEFNLLGSGAYGIKPYLVLSRRGRITPHANIGYQWNGFSNLYVNPCFTTTPSCEPNSRLNPNPLNPNNVLPTLRLPSDLDYSAGVDVGIVKHLTVVADLVGQLFFNAPRVTPPAPVANLPTHFVGIKSIGIKNGDFNDDNLGVGLKLNPVGKLLISANVLIRLNTGGLRADYVPLIGVSYKF